MNFPWGLASWSMSSWISLLPSLLGVVAGAGAGEHLPVTGSWAEEYRLALAWVGLTDPFPMFPLFSFFFSPQSNSFLMALLRVFSYAFAVSCFLLLAVSPKMTSTSRHLKWCISRPKKACWFPYHLYFSICKRRHFEALPYKKTKKKTNALYWTLHIKMLIYLSIYCSAPVLR